MNNKYYKYKMKYLNITGGTKTNINLSDNIKHLLNVPSPEDGNDDISILKKLLEQYKSTAQDVHNNRLFTYDEYYKAIIKYKPNCLNLDNLTPSEKKERIKDLGLCQSHGGDLFAHSQWSALQIINWFENNNEIIKNLDLPTTVVCAFFHDIGKAYDCKYNMYDTTKYDGKGDITHPEYCGDVILGKIKLRKCTIDSNIYDECINVNDLLKNNFKDIDLKLIALTAYMHWEFGKLNMGDEKLLDSRILGTSFIFKHILKILHSS